MKAGTILLIARDVVEDLLTAGLLLPSGDFSNITLGAVVAIGSSVNATLTKYGVKEPEEVQKVLAALSVLGPLL